MYPQTRNRPVVAAEAQAVAAEMMVDVGKDYPPLLIYSGRKDDVVAMIHSIWLG